MGRGLKWTAEEKRYLLDAIKDLKPKLIAKDDIGWTKVAIRVKQKMTEAYPSLDPSSITRKTAAYRNKFYQMKRNTKNCPSEDTRTGSFFAEASKLAIMLQHHHRTLNILKYRSDASFQCSNRSNEENRDRVQPVSAALGSASHPQPSGSSTDRADAAGALNIVVSNATSECGGASGLGRVVCSTTVAKNYPSQSAMKNSTVVREENVLHQVNNGNKILSEASEPEPVDRTTKRPKKKMIRKRILRSAISNRTPSKKLRGRSRTGGIAESTSLNDSDTAEENSGQENDISNKQLLALMLMSQNDPDLARTKLRQDQEENFDYLFEILRQDRENRRKEWENRMFGVSLQLQRLEAQQARSRDDNNKWMALCTLLLQSNLVLAKELEEKKFILERNAAAAAAAKAATENGT